MANTVIKIPYLPGDLGYTVDVVDPSDLLELQTNIALSVVSGVHQGTVTGSHAGMLIFVIRNSGSFVEHRIRTIADDAGPYTILTGLDSGDSIGVSLPGNPSDDALFSTGWLICYDEDGERENGVPITVTLKSGAGVAGIGLDTESRTKETATVNVSGEDVPGYVEFPGFRRGATYSVSRGGVVSAPNPFAIRSSTGGPTFVVPDAASFAITEVLGKEV